MFLKINLLYPSSTGPHDQTPMLHDATPGSLYQQSCDKEKEATILTLAGENYHWQHSVPVILSCH